MNISQNQEKPASNITQVSAKWLAKLLLGLPEARRRICGSTNVSIFPKHNHDDIMVSLESRSLPSHLSCIKNFLEKNNQIFKHLFFLLLDIRNRMSHNIHTPLEHGLLNHKALKSETNLYTLSFQLLFSNCWSILCMSFNHTPFLLGCFVKSHKIKT